MASLAATFGGGADGDGDAGGVYVGETALIPGARRCATVAVPPIAGQGKGKGKSPSGGSGGSGGSSSKVELEVYALEQQETYAELREGGHADEEAALLAIVERDEWLVGTKQYCGICEGKKREAQDELKALEEQGADDSELHEARAAVKAATYSYRQQHAGKHVFRRQEQGHTGIGLAPSWHQICSLSPPRPVPQVI